jgi:hypothetical protein
MEFRLDDFKMFINTWWYDNVDDYDFLRLKNVLSNQKKEEKTNIYSLGLKTFNHLKKNLY